MTFAPGVFQTATIGGVREVRGYTYAGLGLKMIAGPSPKGRRKAVWTITHLNTGHAVANITGPAEVIFPIAVEIADASDWDFAGLAGWKNRDPELGVKVRAILARHKQALPGRGAHHEGTAQQIASARIS